MGLDLGGHRQVCGPNTQENSIEATVCLSDDDGLKHIDSLLKSKHTWIRRLRREKPSVVESCFRVGVDQTGTVLGY